MVLWGLFDHFASARTRTFFALCAYSTVPSCKGKEGGIFHIWANFITSIYNVRFLQGFLLKRTSFCGLR